MDVRTIVWWIWENRTKCTGYLGMGLAQLGTSGVLANPKAVAWVAFGASMCAAAVGHHNDWKAKRNVPPAQ